MLITKRSVKSMKSVRNIFFLNNSIFLTIVYNEIFAISFFLFTFARNINTKTTKKNQLYYTKNIL